MSSLSLSVNGNNTAGSAYPPGLTCGPHGMRDVGTLGKHCHILQIFGAGVLGRAVSACPGFQAQVGMTLPIQAQKILLGKGSGLTEKRSGAVHVSVHTLGAGPALR